MSSSRNLAALRAMWKKDSDKKTSFGSDNKRGDTYPFWSMNIGEKAIVRFLPDANVENPYQFYVDKLEHVLSINGKDEKIPCLAQYGDDSCPICKLSRDFYKLEGKESVNGKYYYRNKTSIVRVLVLEDPLKPDPETGETSVGKVYKTQIGYQLMEKIKAELASEDLDNDIDPWSLKRGLNFTIKKSPQGQYGKYDLESRFSVRPTPIPDEYLDQIELIDLATLLPRNPGFDVVKRKLDIHLNGTDEGDEEDNGSEEVRKPSPPVVPVASSKVKTQPLTEAAVDDDDLDDKEADDEGDQEEYIPPPKNVAKPSRTAAAPVAATEEDDDDEIMRQIRERRAARAAK